VSQFEICRDCPVFSVTDELLDMSHLCKLMDDANPAKPRGPYKKREAVS
jgi:hypothetical protein